jgi:hypothetical protein
MKRLLTLLLLTLPCFPLFAQREADNWFFGDHASLEFNRNGVPVSFANSAMLAPEGCASISDEFGNLLFYTNGETVWNQLHLPMANGTGLNGNSMASQSAMIVKKPGSNSHFYIFTKSNSFGNNNLSYSEVDMTAYNGIGEVIAATKNTALLPSSTPVHEKITAVYQANHRDIWVITARNTGNSDLEFVSFSVTASGVSTNYVASPVANGLVLGRNGCLKASPTGNHLAAAFGMHNCWLLDFNNKTGVVSNPRVVIPNLATQFGVEFSPDGTKLYFAGNGIHQVNISLPTPAAIIASRVALAPITTLAGTVQLASNGKIYVVGTSPTSLMEIANPNVAGLACNLRQGPTLAPLTFNRTGLPNFMQGYFAPPRFTIAGICQNSPIVFTIPDQTGIDSVKWDFGDPLSGVTNTSGSLQPTHIFHRSGFFRITLTVYIGGVASYFTRQFDVRNAPLVGLGPDTTYCNGMEITLSNAFPRSTFNESILWSNGETNSLNIKVKNSGIYWLEMSNGVCSVRDSIRITFVEGPKVDIGGDTTVCGERPLTLGPKAGIDTMAIYLWQPGGQKTPTIQVTKTGLYQLIMTKNGCSATDVRNVKFIPGLAFNLGANVEVCEGETVVLKAPNIRPVPVFLWSDTTAGTTMKVTKPGKYWLRVTRNNCSVSDTVIVRFKSCPPPIIPFIPNIITPNADNTNDKLVIGNLPEGVYWSLKLYNRWGQLLLDEPEYRYDWPKKNLMDGTYYYLLVEPSTGRTFKGWLEVTH